MRFLKHRHRRKNDSFYRRLSFSVSGTRRMWEMVMGSELILLAMVEPEEALKQGIAMIIFDF